MPKKLNGCPYRDIITTMRLTAEDRRLLEELTLSLGTTSLSATIRLLIHRAVEDIPLPRLDNAVKDGSDA